MDNKIHKYELYTADFYASETSTIYKHIAYADTFEEAIEILVKKQDCHRSDPKEYKKIVNEIRSHSESELEGCEEICLYGGCSYYHEYLRKVPGYVDASEKQTDNISLAQVLCRELKNVGEEKWELQMDSNNSEFTLRIGNNDPVALPNKYVGLMGLPQWKINDYYVYEISYGRKCYADRIAYINNDNWGNMDWQTVSVEQVEMRLKEWWKEKKLFFSEQEAIESLPNEIILHYRSGNTSISPYDSYGYHIVSISAHSGGPIGNDDGVYVHIRR